MIACKHIWLYLYGKVTTMSKSKASKMRFCACGLISYNQKGYTMSDTKTREPQQKRSIEKKNRIIEVGFLLMCEKGYQKTTTADIAKAAGVSTGIIYSYFTDKHDIFMDGLKAYSQKMMVPVFEEFTLPFDPKTSLERIVDSLIESHKIFNHAHKEIEALTMTNDEVAVLMADMELKTTLQLEEFLRNAGYDCENLAEKTHIIYNMVDSLSHELTFHKHPGLNPNQMKAIVIDTILYLLGTPHQS